MPQNWELICLGIAFAHQGILGAIGRTETQEVEDKSINHLIGQGILLL